MALLRLMPILFAIYLATDPVSGHGYMSKPINRASLWRTDETQPINYNDNEFFCGGTHVQYDINNGKCGPCGDDWRDAVPRSNENGGTYGNGIIVANYTAGSTISVTSMITANHLGSIYFHICELQSPSDIETEECFQDLRLANGHSSLQIKASYTSAVKATVQLPEDLVCDRCVLRWHYRTGNSWGLCEDGTQNVGCGNQEVFRSCADIRILPKDSDPDNDDYSSPVPDNGDDSDPDPDNDDDSDPDNDPADNPSDEDDGSNPDNDDKDPDEVPSEENDSDTDGLPPCIFNGALYPIDAQGLEHPHDGPSEENDSHAAFDIDGLQPCILKGILYPLNVHNPDHRRKQHETNGDEEVAEDVV